ncbi:unnamed protein product [Ambrosiozyma monospora]|uniref:Unnamed protein product n=1 Tax=Ambrosiozyma monospora TaxID=43982 RepID=A0ACB5SXJ3_AMBMO|nr:unnamed protein product [Ambrosiozyma monospora]
MILFELPKLILGKSPSNPSLKLDEAPPTWLNLGLEDFRLADSNNENSAEPVSLSMTCGLLCVYVVVIRNS